MCLRDVGLIIQSVLGLGTVHDLRACFWEAVYPPRHCLKSSLVPHLREGAIPISQCLITVRCLHQHLISGSTTVYFLFFRFLFTIVFHPIVPSLPIFLFSFCSFFTFSNTHFSHYLCTLDDFYRLSSGSHSEANNLW